MTAAGGTRADGVAVIGVGCRFAGGAEDVDGFWAFLDRGGDAIGMVPGDRWEAGTLDDYGPPAPGEPYRLRGAFIEDIAGWDAQLFRVSAQEALRTDPQHRLVFEVVWRALEDAGIDPATLRSTQAGVFVGVTVSEQYARLQRECDPACGGDPYMTTGSTPSMAAGRVAYFLGTHGPALSIDTACSTSLVAVHLARQSLLRGECDLAIVAAATALTYPDTYTATYRVGMLAEDSRCRAFDRRANGFSLGEGAGAVILCRLPDAAAPGRRVRAIARGTAVNSDGGGRGLTAPNRHAQVAVIREALRSGGLAPDDVALVEAHGSGTALGDAIELEALGEVFGPRPADRPLYVGAVKTNLGHLLSAAGMAGLVKTLLALEHRRMPPNLHFETPNPILRRTPWLVPPTAPVPLAGDGPLIAGISSFGWSGTNAHVVLERPAGPAEPVDRPAPRPFTRVRYWPRPVGDRWAVRAANAGLAPAGLAAAPPPVGTGVVGAGPVGTGSVGTGVAGAEAVGTGSVGTGVAGAEDRPGGAAEPGAAGSRALYCYARTWRQTVAPPARPPGHRPGSAVLLADEPRTAEPVGAALRAAGWSVVTAVAGDGSSLAAALAAGAGDVHLVSCLTADPTGVPPADRARAAFTGLMTAVQTVTRLRGRPPAALLAVVSGTVDVLGGDAGSVGDAAVAGLCRAMRAEYPMLRTRVVDVDPAPARASSATAPVVAAQVLAELDALTMPAGEPNGAGPAAGPNGAGPAAGPNGAGPATGPGGDVLVAWRNGRRWVPDWTPLEPAAGSSPWRAGGVYVITGGTRGLGLALARRLAAAGAGGLVLAGRTPLPPRREWDAILLGAAAAGEAAVADGVRRTIGDIRRLERTGTAVLALSADVSTPAGMRDVLRLAAERFGRVHGVAHCAGVAGGGLLDRKTAAEAAAVIDPKVAGLPALDEAIRAGGLEVVVLYSSAVTALGGLGESDYAAANACLEAFAAAHAAGPTRVVAVAWGAWQHGTGQHETGPRAAGQGAAGQGAGAPWLAEQVRRYRAVAGIPLAEGTGMVDRLAGAGQPVALVLTEPIEVARAQWAALADPDALTAGSPRGPAQPRPDLAVAYVPPRAGRQTQIAEVWRHYLGLTEVGVDDPFFELGGTSLVSVSIARRLERELGVALAPAALFEWPTIRELAAALSDAASSDTVAADAAQPAGGGRGEVDGGDGALRRQLRSVGAQARRRELESQREERP